MPSRPSPFDDDDDITADDDARSRSARSGRSRGAARSTATDVEEPEGRRPNYTIRRGIVVVAAIAIVGGVAFAFVNLRDDSSDRPTSGSIAAEWNRIVLIDPRTGRLTVDNPNGEEIARIDTAVRAVAAAHIVGPDGLVVGDDVALVDVQSEEVTPLDIDADTIELPSGSSLTMIAPSENRGRGILVNGGETLDTDDYAPIAGARYEFSTARSDPTGRNVLVTDPGNFQSVLLSFDQDEPSFFRGLALAIDSDLVVTAQNVGSNATISIFDHQGESVAEGQTTSSRAALIAGDTVQIVTVDGDVIAMDASSGETEQSGQLDIGEIQAGYVSTNGEQLIVIGSSGTALVHGDGGVIAEFVDQFPVDTDQAIRGSTCIALAGAASDGVVIAELSTGSVQAEATTSGPFFTSADGCTVAADSTNGIQLISDARSQGIDTDGDIVAFAPDASAMIVDDDRLALVSVEDPEDPVDIGPSTRRATFTNAG